MKKYKSINHDQAKEIMDKDNPVIIDVRPGEVYKKGHIPGAINIPLADLKAGSDLAPEAKDQKILVHCADGVWAREAAQYLSDEGYTDVSEFGDLDGWPYELEKSE